MKNPPLKGGFSITHKHLENMFSKRIDSFTMGKQVTVVVCNRFFFFWIGSKDGAGAKVSTSSGLVVLNEAFYCL